MSTTFGGGQGGSDVKSFGRALRAPRGLVLATLMLTGGIALVTACGGDEFCEESRTCPPTATAGAGGEGAGGADSTVGGIANTSAGAPSAGAGGDATVVACTTDADCDNNDACDGEESCLDNVCKSGVAMQCPVGLACDATVSICLPATASPWILYASDDDAAGVVELYAVKPDFLGKMQPIKITPKLVAGWTIADVGFWSPDGQAAIVRAKNQAGDEAASYLLRFVDGLPMQPILVTGGLPASKQSTPVWSPSGRTLGITRDDGFFLIDIDAKDVVTQTELDSQSQDSVSAWFKSDSEIPFVARTVVTQKFTVAVAKKSGADWAIEPIKVDLVASTFTATADASLVSYLTFDMATMQASAWSLETVKGATPTKVVGPFVDLGLQVSSDGKNFTMATTLKLGGESTAFGGPISQLTTPPVLKDHLALKASVILPQAIGAGWSPDGEHAALYQPDSFGRQLVMYEPGAATEWNPLALHQISEPGPSGDPVWSPDSKVVALYGQAAADAAVELLLVSTQSHDIRSLDQVGKGGFVQLVEYTAGSEFLSYRKAIPGSPSFAGGLVDLRQGFAQAAALPFSDKVTHQEFAAHSLDLVYSDGASCNYVDLAGAKPAKAVQVNGPGKATLCRFQVLPK